ncbi:MAG: peptidoglycan-binding protein, partial [Alphaproteobacteria bacterium]|nr:peptidoglycan-binding protein [Alphaproteobacteria bacterium]
MSKIVAALLFPLLMNFSGPALAGDDLAADDSPPADMVSAPSSDALRNHLSKRDDTGIRGQVASFYATRDFKPAWIDPHVNGEVDDVLSHAGDQGLRPQDYSVSAKLKGADREIARTEALFRYAYDVRLGRVAPGRVYKDVRLPPSTFDFGWMLSQALAHHSVPAMLAALPPPQPEYRGLVAALQRYRDVVTAGGWPAVTAKNTAGLAHRLALEDSAFSEIIDPSDVDVAAAVTRFQERNGLPVDGHAGPATLKQLNIPASARV